MSAEIYQRLVEHLDQMPGGFGPSTTGADIRLLEMLFTPDEARLAVHVTLDRADAATIAERAAQSADVVAPMLDEMARKGLIYSVLSADGPTQYSAVPFVVGIYEFQVGRLSPELLARIDDYWRTAKSTPKAPSIDQMRTIPIAESVTQDLAILPYEQVSRLVDAHDRFAVSDCICRKAAAMHDSACDAPLESCLHFGDFADYAVRVGMARNFDKAEVTEILGRADKADLVLQPTNSEVVSAICCCCGCCCGILYGLQRQEKPAEAVQNAFIAQFDAESCIGCMTCLDRCQMDAISDDCDIVAFNADRCIGCGLCVSTCPSGALTLVRKPGQPDYEMPATFEDTYRVIARQQAGAENPVA